MTPSAAVLAPLNPVAPVKPAAAYIGGKRNLSRRLCALIDTIPHRTYVEPFVGMGGVFLRRSLRPAAEVMNDISGDVVNLYRILQRHYQALMDELRWKVTSRAEFDRLVKQDATTLTDIERAVRFLYLQRLAFGGKVNGRNFGVSKTTPARFDVTKLEPMLADIHERIAPVVLEQLPYAECIRRYDAPGTLFYLDPPYWACEDDYGDGVFDRGDFAELAGILAGISGRFILSINDRPEVRAIFARFEIADADVTYRVAGTPTQARELIITGG